MKKYVLCGDTFGTVRYHGEPAPIAWNVNSFFYFNGEAREFVIYLDPCDEKPDKKICAFQETGKKVLVSFPTEEVVGAYLGRAARPLCQEWMSPADIQESAHEFALKKLEVFNVPDDAPFSLSGVGSLLGGIFRITEMFCVAEILRYTGRFRECEWVCLLQAPESLGLFRCRTPWVPVNRDFYEKVFQPNPLDPLRESSNLPF